MGLFDCGRTVGLGSSEIVGWFGNLAVEGWWVREEASSPKHEICGGRLFHLKIDLCHRSLGFGILDDF